MRQDTREIAKRTPKPVRQDLYLIRIKRLSTSSLVNGKTSGMRGLIGVVRVHKEPKKMHNINLKK